MAFTMERFAVSKSFSGICVHENLEKFIVSCNQSVRFGSHPHRCRLRRAGDDWDTHMHVWKSRRGVEVRDKFICQIPRSFLKTDVHRTRGLDHYIPHSRYGFESGASREGGFAEDSNTELTHSIESSSERRRFLSDYEGGGDVKVLRRRDWESESGRNVKKKHGGRMTAMLKALETTEDIDEALAPWNGWLKTKEQTIILNEQRSWYRALQIFGWLKDQENYKPNSYLYNIMLRVCGRARKWHLVQSLWSEMVTNNVTATNFTYSILIDVNARAGRKEEATFWFERMKEKGLQPDEVTMTTLVSVYKRFGDLEEGRRLFESLQWPMQEDVTSSDCEPRSVLVSLLEFLRRFGQQTEYWSGNYLAGMPHLLVFAPVSHVLEELAAMEIIKFENQESTEEEAISKLSSQDMLLKDQLVEEKEILDSVPPLGGGNVVGENSQPKIVDTYNIMMDLYARAGQFGEASKVFSDMGKAGVAPDIVTYNCMIHTCGRAGRVQEAKAIFKKIIEEGPVPNVATYNILISMFIKRRDKKMALKYYQKMKAGGLTPDAVTFRIILRDTMISVADVGLRVDLSKHLTMMMEELAAGVGEYIHKSEITQTILLNLYKKSGMRQEASAVAERMWKGDLLSNLVSFNSVLEMSRTVTEAREVFERMQMKGIAPDIFTYNRLAGILKKAGLVEDALEQLENADSAGIPLNLHTLTTAATLYGHAGMHEEALEACDALRNSGFSLDTVAYTAMIYAYGNAGRLDEALRVSMEMQTRGLEPDVVTYTTVISVYAKMGLVEGVTRLFKRMKRAGCEPDEITYNAVIASYKDAGREDLAAMVYQEKQFARYVSEQSKREAMARSPLTDTLESMAQSTPTDDSES